MTMIYYLLQVLYSPSMFESTKLTCIPPGNKQLRIKTKVPILNLISAIREICRGYVYDDMYVYVYQHQM